MLRAQTLGAAFLELGLEWFEEDFKESLELYTKSSVFNAAITTYLMIAQRGLAGNTLSSTIQQMRQGASLHQVAQLISKSKKYVMGTLSSNPGGFCNARKRLALEKVQEFSHYISEQADKKHRVDATINGYQCYIFDGSTILLQNNSKICSEFTPLRNQHKICPPVARIVVAHNLVTGVAFCPAIGSQYDSEQKLSVSVMDSIPKKSVVLADRNFGVFSVAWNLGQRSLLPLVRLRKTIAGRILGVKEGFRDGDYAVTWTPSSDERETTEFPEGAKISGRLIIITIGNPGRKAEQFYFFTTATDLSPLQVAEMYNYRWFIETDLKTIKQTVNLDVVKAKTPEMVRKEIILGIVAYTLIRTIIAQGAKEIGLKPRQISFTRAREYIMTMGVLLAKATNMKELQRTLASFFPGFKQLKLPNRTKKRIEPRALVRRDRTGFPILKKSRDEARNEIIQNMKQN